MNIQLVDSIVQMIGNLPPAERELVKQKLFASKYLGCPGATRRSPVPSTNSVIKLSSLGDVIK